MTEEHEVHVRVSTCVCSLLASGSHLALIKTEDKWVAESTLILKTIFFITAM